MRTTAHHVEIRRAQLLKSSRFQATDRHHSGIVVGATRSVMHAAMVSNICCCGANGGVSAFPRSRATAAFEDQLSQCCCNSCRCSSESLQDSEQTCTPMFAVSSNALTCFNLHSARTCSFVSSKVFRFINTASSAKLRGADLYRPRLQNCAMR